MWRRGSFDQKSEIALRQAQGRGIRNQESGIRDKGSKVNYHRLMALAFFGFLWILPLGARHSGMAADSSQPNSLQPTSPAADHSSALSTQDSSHLQNPLSLNPLFTEAFDDLDAWEEMTFPKIPRHSIYTIEPDTSGPGTSAPGSIGNGVLRAQSDGSASGMIWKGEFNVYKFPRLSWKWKVSNTYEKGNATTKSGDDYPIRLYVMFKYVPSDPAVKPSLKYLLARLFYGKTPPYTSLNYIWANRDHDQRFLVNPYSDKAMMVVLQAGKDKVGQWVQEDIDIVRDYKEAFGTTPPAIAGLAIMNDSDGTGESSVSWMDDVELYRLENSR